MSLHILHLGCIHTKFNAAIKTRSRSFSVRPSVVQVQLWLRNFCSQLYRCLKLDLSQLFGCHSHTSAANHIPLWSDANTTQRITRLDVTEWETPSPTHSLQLRPSGFGMNSAFGAGDGSSYHKAQVVYTQWQVASFFQSWHRQTKILIFLDNLEFTVLAFFWLWEKAWHSQAHPSYPSQFQYCVLCGVDLRRWLIEEYNQCIQYIGCIGNSTTNQRTELSDSLSVQLLVKTVLSMRLAPQLLLQPLLICLSIWSVDFVGNYSLTQVTLDR